MPEMDIQLYIPAAPPPAWGHPLYKDQLGKPSPDWMEKTVPGEESIQRQAPAV